MDVFDIILFIDDVLYFKLFFCQISRHGLSEIGKKIITIAELGRE